MSYLSAFDLRSGEANYGKIKVYNNDPSPAGTEVAYVSIEAPTGFIKTMDLLTADIDLGSADNELLVDIPVDSSGDWITGIYTILVQDIHPVFGTRNFTYEFDFCPVLGNPTINWVTNCACAKAIVTDATVYGEGASVTRTMTIYPPTIPGSATPASISTSASSYTLDLTHSNVKYQVNLEVSVTQEPIAGVAVLEEISYAEWFKVVCDYDLCSLITCVNRDLTDLENKAARAGGYKNLASADFDRMIQINRLLFKHNNLISCQDWEGVQSTYDELVDVIECDCGCTSTTSSGPQTLSSACSGSGSSLAISATTPITATLVGSTWQLAFSASYKATLDQLKIHNILSSNGDLVVSKSYDAPSDVETVDISIKVNTWTLVDQDAFYTDFVPTDAVTYPGQFGYRLLPGGQIQCFAQLRLDKTLSTGTHPLLDTVLAASYRPDNTTNWFPVMAPTGAGVGLVRLTAAGQVEIYTETDWSAEGWSSSSFVSFNFIAPLNHPALV